MTALSPKRSFDLRNRETRLREDSTFAACAKSFGQFPQTGHTPRNGEDQQANGGRADKVDDNKRSFA